MKTLRAQRSQGFSGCQRRVVVVVVLRRHRRERARQRHLPDPRSLAPRALRSALALAIVAPEHLRPLVDIDPVGLLADEYYRTLHGAPRRGDNGGPGDADGAACVRRERVRRTQTILGMDLDRTSPAALTAAIRRTCAAR